jgi:hypothetical protein
MNYFNYLDAFLLIVYYFLLKKITDITINKQLSANLTAIYNTSFNLRMFGAITYTLVVLFYYGYGDSLGFFINGGYVNSQILKGNLGILLYTPEELYTKYMLDVGDIFYAGYFNEKAYAVMVKIIGLLYFVCCNSYIVIALLFGFYAFQGQWRLFLTFNHWNQGKNQKLLAYTVLYIPSVWFWGSGLLKDSICMGCVGFIVYAANQIIKFKRITIKIGLLLLINTILLFFIKSYILGAIILGACSYVLIYLTQKISNSFLRYLSIFLVIFLALLVFYFSSLDKLLLSFTDEVKNTTTEFQKNYNAVNQEDETSKGKIDLVFNFTSTASLIAQIPYLVFSTIFRPFIWEAKSVFMLFSAAENLTVLIFFFYVIIKKRVIYFFRHLFSQPAIFASFTIVVVLAVMIGITTFNFGTLVRYKIALLPFLSFFLVSLLSTNDIVKK